jgi:hypothetical protein
MSEKRKKEDKQGEDPAGKGKKSKKGKQGKGEQSNVVDARTSVATHPRARAAVRRAKGWGGLTGFTLAAYAAYGAHLPFVQACLHALVAGVAGYVLAWACAVAVCRHLVQAELKTIGERLREAREAAANSSPEAADSAAGAGANG